MPTENRSSNTEMVIVPRGLLQSAAREPSGEVINVSRRHALETLRGLLAQPAPQPHAEPCSYPPCNYCGITPDYHPWHGSGMINGVENRHIHACEGCRGKLPAHPGQPNAEPIAWMVGTAIWWTKEEAERDSAETGLPIVGMGPVVDPSVAERLSAATAFVQRMVECAGTQQSVATGYVRDILDLLKGNATPSAPVELQRMTFEYAHADGERHTVALSRAEVAGYMDEFLFEKLTEEICHCEPIGETNVVDCRCDEVAEQFSLVKPS